jgi:predicted DNA-binding transcriptional regulator AlpA
MSGTQLPGVDAPIFEPPLLLDGPSAAKLLGISERQLRKLEVTGRIPPPVRIGRSVRWSRENLASWVREGCPTAERFEGHSQGGAQ